MKIAKTMFAKVATLGILAAAVAVAAPTKADAQVRFGIAIGGPVYRAPVYAGPVYGGPAYPIYGGYYHGYYGHPYYGRGYYGRGWRR